MFLNSAIIIISLALPSHAQSAQAPKKITAPNTTAKKIAPPPTVVEEVQESTEKVVDYTDERVTRATAPLNLSAENRGSTEWNLGINYALLETWVFSKYGFTAGYNRSAASMYEFEYMRGRIGFGKFMLDIGGIEEQRLSVLWRSFAQRNSFHFLMGLFYDDVRAKLGGAFISTVSGNPRASIDIAQLSTLGLTWGIGNRWQLKSGFVFGIDWFVINVPVITLKKEAPFLNVNADIQKQNAVEDALDAVKSVPTFSLLKLHVGMSF